MASEIGVRPGSQGARVLQTEQQKCSFLPWLPSTGPGLCGARQGPERPGGPWEEAITHSLSLAVCGSREGLLRVPDS